jgi:hypothetical protein
VPGDVASRLRVGRLGRAVVPEIAPTPRVPAGGSGERKRRLAGVLLLALGGPMGQFVRNSGRKRIAAVPTRPTTGPRSWRVNGAFVTTTRTRRYPREQARRTRWRLAARRAAAGQRRELRGLRHSVVAARSRVAARACVHGERHGERQRLLSEGASARPTRHCNRARASYSGSWLEPDSRVRSIARGLGTGTTLLERRRTDRRCGGSSSVREP